MFGKAQKIREGNMGASDIKLKWIHCNNCNRTNEHSLVADYERHGVSEPDELGYSANWMDGIKVWECNGCKELIAERVSYCSETDNDPLGESAIQSILYPERNMESILPKKFWQIPDQLSKLYKEIIKSYNERCDMLCCMGLRALIEGICKDKGVTGDNLEELINKATFIPESIRKNIHGFRFLGNQAVHELSIPQKRLDIYEAICVIEDILNLSYELDYKSTMFYKKIKGNSRKPIP